MNLFTSIAVGATALEAQKVRMNVAASNMANVNSTRTPEGNGPYRRKDVEFSAHLMGEQGVYGVNVTRIVEDQRPFQKVFDPGHPDADAEGLVQLPNVNIIEEMVNMMTATRAYEANITAINNAKAMVQKALELGR